VSVASHRFALLVLVVGIAAVAVGAGFVVRGAIGEDALASWTSALVGLVGGGCCVAWASVRLTRSRR
jgi:hypothetical protein